MVWFSNEELKDMKKSDLENQLRDLEREYDFTKDKLLDSNNDIDFYKNLECKIYFKIKDIENELRSL